ncbi:MAG: toprim domain-containing protein [Methanotrichaceae archaeon]
MQADTRQKRTYDYEALEDIIASLQDASTEGTVIIVEGKRDESALRSLGIRGPVMMASHKSALDLAEDVSRKYSQIIMLTDWDEKGEEMALNIEQHLRSVGSRADMDIRSRLKRLVRKEIKDVESLDFYVERMRAIYSSKP